MNSTVNNRVNAFLGLCTVSAVVALLYVLVTFFEMGDPKVEVGIPGKALGLEGRVSGSVSDEKSGIRNIWISLSVNGKDHVIYDKRFPVSIFSKAGRTVTTEVDAPVDLGKLGLVDGIGYLPESIGTAAKLAGIGEPYSVVTYRRGRFPDDTIYNSAAAMVKNGQPLSLNVPVLSNLEPGFYYLSPLFLGKE